jgi:hypothetical protein
MAKKDSFKRGDADKLMVACHRRCCICHRFCGVKMEIDHIVQRSEDGPSVIENGIAVCFECHAEIHSYNDDHPRGRKFHSEELRQHKEQWLKICASQPTVFAAVQPREAGVGPLQSLVDELEFNIEVSKHTARDVQGCLFMDEQFKRAIQQGAIAILEENLKQVLIEAYRIIGRANQHVLSAMQHEVESEPWARAVNRASTSISDAKDHLIYAHDALIRFVKSEP